MGFWDIIYFYTGDRLKGIAPYLSPVKRAGDAAYRRTSDAVTKIDQVVRVDGVQKLNQYRPDDETTAQIGLFTTTLAKNTGKYVIYEGFKHIPGATVASKLVSDTLREVKQETNKDKIKSTAQPENPIQNSKLISQNSVEGISEKTKIARSRM